MSDSTKYSLFTIIIISLFIFNSINVSASEVTKTIFLNDSIGQSSPDLTWHTYAKFGAGWWLNNQPTFSVSGTKISQLTTSTKSANVYINIYDINDTDIITGYSFYISAMSGVSQSSIVYPNTSSQTSFSIPSIGIIRKNLSTPAAWGSIKNRYTHSGSNKGSFYLSTSSGVYSVGLDYIKIHYQTSEEIDYNGTNNIIFSNTTDWTKSITESPVNTDIYITTWLSSENWTIWEDLFAGLRMFTPLGEVIFIGNLDSQNASQWTYKPDQVGTYTFQTYCDILCGSISTIYYTKTINITGFSNKETDIQFSPTEDYSNSIESRPLNQSFYVNIWLQGYPETDPTGLYRIDVKDPDDMVLGTYYPIKNYYDGSYPIQIFRAGESQGKYGLYTFYLYFYYESISETSLLPIGQSKILLYNSSNFSDTGYANGTVGNISIPNPSTLPISNYTLIIPNALNGSSGYQFFVWVATPITIMKNGVDSINTYYSESNSTKHITILLSIVPILIANFPDKVKAIITYDVTLLVILLILGRD